jgi:hypothetical protein
MMGIEQPFRCPYVHKLRKVATYHIQNIQNIQNSYFHRLPSKSGIPASAATRVPCGNAVVRQWWAMEKRFAFWIKIVRNFAGDFP